MGLQDMSSFFSERVEGYDEHMINEVEGCREGYIKMAELVPKTTKTLLDLGCGTGLELDEILNRLPELKVTGIDLTKAMLDKLREKHSTKDLTLINISYFDYDFGIEMFDTAVSFETLHHFSHEEKTALYRKLNRALMPNGSYIECDYMVQSQEEEEFYYEENKRLRTEMGIAEGFYHYDTPCTVNNEIEMLKSAGFLEVEMIWKMGNTVMIVAKK